MQFAEDYFTNKQSDPQHRPSVKSCLIRIPGTLNSKYNQEVEIVQIWDGVRPPIQYLLRDYRTWLVSEKINDKLEEKRTWRRKNSKKTDYKLTNTITWIENLLQTPIQDHRKYALWRIVFPYLFNIRKMPDSKVISIVQMWLDKCAKLRPLDFKPNYLIRQNIRNSNKNRYLPISFERLRTENNKLYDIILRFHGSSFYIS